MLLRIIIYVLVFQVAFIGGLYLEAVPTPGEAAFIACLAVLVAIFCRTVFAIIQDIERRRSGEEDLDDLEEEDEDAGEGSDPLAGYRM